MVAAQAVIRNMHRTLTSSLPRLQEECIAFLTLVASPTGVTTGATATVRTTIPSTPLLTGTPTAQLITTVTAANPSAPPVTQAMARAMVLLIT